MTAMATLTAGQERTSGPLRDGLGRRIDHLRLSVTDQCDLRCRYCRPNARQERGHAALTDAQRLRFLQLLMQAGGLSQVRFTGGEPLLHPTLPALIADTRRLSATLDIALTTNGRRLHDCAADLRRAGLNRINVSLDTLDPDRYHDLTGGELDAVLRGLDTAHRVGLHPIRINAVVLAGINDEQLPSMVRWAGEHGLEIRFLEAMPVGTAAGFNRVHFVSATQILERLWEAFSVSDMGREPGSTAHHYHVTAPGWDAKVGIIAPVTRPFCGDCRRMRLTADGRLFPCLQDSRNIPLSPLLATSRDDEEVWQAVVAAIADKPAAGSAQSVQMVQLGG